MDCSEEDEGFEAFICLVITRCDTSELFEITEEVLNEMPPSIHGEVTGDCVLAISFRRDDGFGLRFTKELTQSIVVEAFVGQQRLHVEAFDQAGCRYAVVALPGKQNEAGKISQRIDEGNDLCRQSAARTPDGLTASPPFAPMPC